MSADRALRWGVRIAVFLYPFSMLFLGGGFLPEGFGWTGTMTLLLYATLLWVSSVRPGNLAMTITIAVGIGGALFIIEAIGVRTGFPFGRYEYTAVLQPLVAGVPVAIAVAWYATLLSTWRIARWLLEPAPASRVRTALLAGFLTVGLDIVLEPFAVSVGRYWSWTGGHVPPQNYAAWFAISTLVVWMLGGKTAASAAPRLQTALLVYALQFALFCPLLLLRGHVVEVLAACALVGLSLIVSRVAAGGRLSWKGGW